MIAPLSCKGRRGLLVNMGVDILWEACILKENVGFGVVHVYREEMHKGIRCFSGNLAMYFFVMISTLSFQIRI